MPNTYYHCPKCNGPVDENEACDENFVCVCGWSMTPPHVGEIARGTCATCGETVARSTACDDCGKCICLDCAEVWGGNYYCPAHRITCERCGSNYGTDMAGWCEVCDKAICENCQGWCEGCNRHLCEEHLTECDECEEWWCPDCNNDPQEHECAPTAYVSPYADKPKAHNVFTFGVEIEINGQHDSELFEESRLIAAHCADYSMHETGAQEYQTQPMTTDPDTVRDLTDLIATIHVGEQAESYAGGHIHISRTLRQTPTRWYWALVGLSDEQAGNLNMRHTNPHNNSWCELRHSGFTGKDTAINDDHPDTIELRTFGAWYANTAGHLPHAVAWLHTMWRFFQRFETGTLHSRDIERMAQVAYANTISMEAR